MFFFPFFKRSKSARRKPVAPRPCRLALEPLEVRNLLAVYTVDNTNDSGSGSLRDAINQANAGTYDTIEFNLVAPYTIAPASALPAITHDNVTINGGGAGPGLEIEATGAFIDFS